MGFTRTLAKTAWGATAAALFLAACQTPIAESLVGVPRPASLRKAFEQTQGQGGMSGAVLLTAPAAAWAARWEMLRDARRSVDATYFIIENDPFGLAFLGHLYKLAAEGKKVRLLIDGRGSVGLATSLFGRDYLQELVATGNADVHVFNPPGNQLLRSLLEVNAVPFSAGTHNKILVVDDDLAITGGRNLGADYFSTPSEVAGAVMDTDVLLDGDDAVAAVRSVMEREFGTWQRDDVAADIVNFASQHDELMMMYGAMDAWLSGAIPASSEADEALALEAAALAQVKTLPERRVRDKMRPYFEELAHIHSLRGVLPMKPLPNHPSEVQAVPASSFAVQRTDNINDALMRAIGGARRSITFQSPYFILTPRLLHALESASRRGVQITLFTNSPLSSDNPPSQALFIDTWPELMARMPTLRVFACGTRQLQHAKRLVIDDDLTLIGSYNIDPLSFYVNSELVLAVWSREFNAQNRAEIESRLSDGSMIEYRIARDERRRPRRYPKGFPHAGEVMVAYGPRNFVPQSQIDDLLTLKQILIGLRNVWDFEVVVW